MILQLTSSSLITINPDNTKDLPNITKAIFIGTGGDVNIIAAHDDTPVSIYVQSGTLLPIRAKKILSSGTTASNIVGLL